MSRSSKLASRRKLGACANRGDFSSRTQEPPSQPKIAPERVRENKRGRDRMTKNRGIRHRKTICPNCGKSFLTNMHNQLYCSKNCGVAYRGLGFIGQPCRICNTILTEQTISGKGKTGQRICKQCRRDWMRHRVIFSSQDGNKRQIFCSLDKRPYPKDECCEICSNTSHRLAYHHWNDAEPDKGIWICSYCHGICNFFERSQTQRVKHIIETYLFLKNLLQVRELIYQK